MSATNEFALRVAGVVNAAAERGLARYLGPARIYFGRASSLDGYLRGKADALIELIGLVPGALAEGRFLVEELLATLLLVQAKDLHGAAAPESVEAVAGQLTALLVAKNQAYGNSALDPVRVFSRVSTLEQLRVRLDDKLSRLARGSAAGEDVLTDLLGYLVLLRLAMDAEAGA